MTLRHFRRHFLPTPIWNLAIFWRETYPKLKQQFQRNYPKHDWREQALIPTQNVEYRLFFFQ